MDGEDVAVMEKVLDVGMGDVVVLRKQHPCGADRWDVVRIGAAIGLQCQGCSRRVLLERPELRRRLKRIERPGGRTQSPN